MHMMLMIERNYNMQYVTSLIGLKNTLIAEQYTRLASRELLLSQSWSIVYFELHKSISKLTHVYKVKQVENCNMCKNIFKKFGKNIILLF